MNTIGIRVTTKSVVFVIYDTDALEVKTVEEIIIPVAFQIPDALKYIRCTLLDILREFEVKKAGIRMTETKAERVNIPRVQLEGVILEAFASSELHSYYVGYVSSISSRLGLDRTKFRPLVEGSESPEIESWISLNKVQREAVLCAIGAKNA